MQEVIAALHELLASGGRGALATVVRTSGSTPQQPGARLLLRGDGSLVGTVGGGAIEHEVVAALRVARETGASQLMARELGYDLGMCCGGRMEIFVEPLEPSPRLILFGAGHVAKPTAALARSVGFRVMVVDEREEQNTGERFPGCERQVDEPTGVLRRVAPGERDFILIATHDHRLDEEILALALALDARPRYIGLVGSRRKTFRLLQRIARRRGGVGDLPGVLEGVYAPVGLDIGAVGPEEIAVSIVGELVALRHGRVSSHLRAVDQLLRLGLLATTAEPHHHAEAEAEAEAATEAGAAATASASGTGTGTEATRPRAPIEVG